MAPSLSARGLNLLNNVLLSTHYGPLRTPPGPACLSRVAVDPDRDHRWASVLRLVSYASLPPLLLRLLPVSEPFPGGTCTAEVSAFHGALLRQRSIFGTRSAFSFDLSPRSAKRGPGIAYSILQACSQLARNCLNSCITCARIARTAMPPQQFAQPPLASNPWMLFGGIMT